jgi:D-alanine-D-alanine ligase
MKLRPGMKIGVLYGGLSAEREVSLKSGQAVGAALAQRGYEVVLLDVDRGIAETLRREGVERVFIALHGIYGEDGTIQGLLEYLQIPYTGPGVMGSALAMDKVMTKRLLLAAGLPTPEFTVPEEPAAKVSVPAGGYPLVVKPVAEGSSLGMSVVKQPEELLPALAEARRYSSRVMIESFIAGRELTSAVLEDRALPLIEIRPRGGVYDYQAKYTKGYTEYLVPAPLPDEVVRKVGELACASVRALHCTRGAVRVDFRLDEQFEPYVIEVNTVPGMTETSLLPQAAAAAGIDFPALVERILEGAGLDLATG